MWNNEHIQLGITIGVISILAIITNRTIKWILNKKIDLDAKQDGTNITRLKFFRNALTFIVWATAGTWIIYTIPQLRALAITLFAGAGLLMVSVGFAAQQAFSNIVSGIFIVIFKPFRVGDMIRIADGQPGMVEDITLRHTVIISFENKRIIIPNSNISAETITNETISDPKICRFIEIGVDYDTDITKAKKIIQGICEKHPFCIDNRTPEDIQNEVPKVMVRFISFDDSSLKIRAYMWVKNPIDGIIAHSEINEQILSSFRIENIEIPFPHRTIVYKKNTGDGKKTT